MKDIKLNINNALGFIDRKEMEMLSYEAVNAQRVLEEGTGRGNDFLGWVDLPVNYNKDEYSRVKTCAERIRNQSDALVVIGIGGSYLGARAVIDSLVHSFYNQLSDRKRNGPLIFYAGNNISPSYMAHLMELLEDREVSLNVVSKSGTTTEPAIAFRTLKNFMEKKYGKDGAKERIYATTDSERGALKKLSDSEGYESFVIPDNVGGRYSVLTAVGLLPIASAGIDTDALLEGAAYFRKKSKGNSDIYNNDALLYPVVRNCLYKSGKTTEIMVNYEPGLHFFAEWWKQLYGESEGKDGKGIFPAGVDFSTDLHSMGQYIQDGMRNLFETVLNVRKPLNCYSIVNDEKNTDGLNFISGMDMGYVNSKAFEGTIIAHVDGGVPNLVLDIPCLDAYTMGQLVYFFEKSCGISGYMLGVNPFDQPGVEAYKKNMFALLGKPGFEELKTKLEQRLKNL